ncbi:MAG: leucine-rich repeat domain-containing protein, partial [Clostridiales bacterium]|nr:leucine-rich repeat domain-containing protein [Clostridiales bacterium]
TQLTSLSLHGNEISDISTIANLTNLTQLSLHWCNITDAEPLYDLPSLEYLHITYGNDLSDAQIEALREALPDTEIGLKALR